MGMILIILWATMGKNAAVIRHALKIAQSGPQRTQDDLDRTTAQLANRLFFWLRLSGRSESENAIPNRHEITPQQLVACRRIGCLNVRLEGIQEVLI